MCLHAEALKHARTDIDRLTQVHIPGDPPSGPKSTSSPSE